MKIAILGLSFGLFLISSMESAFAQITSVTKPLQYKQTKMGSQLHNLYQQRLVQLNNPIGQTVLGQFDTPLSTLKIVTPVQGGYVPINAYARRPSEAKLLLADLNALGFKNGSVYKHLVSGQMPIAAIPQAEQLSRLKYARLSLCQPQVGLTTSQGDAAMWSDLARNHYGFDGTGIRVGVISDSFDSLGEASLDQSTDDLPPDVVILKDIIGGTDEGRAMAQIVHDVAPKASIAFHSAYYNEADFANGILALASLGCKVIADDIIYYAEPMFADGIVAQAVDIVKSYGVAYFSSAGNQARQAWTGAFTASAPVDFGTNITWSYISSHDFDASAGVDNFIHITLHPGTTHFVFQWDQPYFSASGGAGCASDLDVAITLTNGTFIGVSALDNIGSDPIEFFSLQLDSGTVELNLSFHLYSGDAPAKMKMVWFGRATVQEYATASGTVYGHSNAKGAIATGAAYYRNTPAFGQDPVLLNSYSSSGYTEILFDQAGNRLGTPEIRAKPEIIGPDYANTTFFVAGYDPEPDGFPNFPGTSASVVHVAGVAALLLDERPFSPDQIKQVLTTTTINKPSGGFDYDFGYGYIQAEAAIRYWFDLDGNGVVNKLDYNLLMNQIRVRSRNQRYDMNGDGLVTIADARYLVLHYTP